MNATATKAKSLTWVFIPLSLILFISTLDQTITATALNGIVKDLGHLDQASWIITGFMLTSAVMTLIFGKLGDLFGRKRILQIALAIFMIGLLWSGLSTSMFGLIIARTFQGIGAGGLNSLVQAITADVVPARSRGRYQAIFGMISMISLLAGPILGGYFVQYLTWQWIFFINVPIGLLASVILALKLKLPTHAGEQMTIDYLGSLVATVLTTLTLLIVTLGGAQIAWQSSLMMTMLAATIVTLLLYIWIEHRQQNNALTPLTLFKNRTFNNAVIEFALATAALFVAMIFVPMEAQTVQHISASQSGYVIIPTMIAMILATMISGAIIERTGRYKIFPLIGSLLLAVGFYGLAQFTGASELSLLLWQLPVGFGVGLFVQVAMLAGQNTVPVRHLGTATGVLNFFKTLGGAFGAAIFGVILSNSLKLSRLVPMHAFQSVFMWTLPVAAILFILGMLLKEEPLSEEVLAFED